MESSTSRAEFLLLDGYGSLVSIEADDPAGNVELQVAFVIQFRRPQNRDLHAFSDEQPGLALELEPIAAHVHRRGAVCFYPPIMVANLNYRWLIERNPL